MAESGAEPGQRPEPIAKLSNYLMVAASCSRCRTSIRMTFSEVAQQQRLSCENCGLSFGFNFDDEVLSTTDRGFRALEDTIRDFEAWVEVRPYP